MTDKELDLRQVLCAILLNWFGRRWGYLGFLILKYFWIFLGICLRNNFCINIAVRNLSKYVNVRMFSLLNRGVVASALFTLQIILNAFFCCKTIFCRLFY
jgi:hypothetical protein